MRVTSLVAVVAPHTGAVVAPHTGKIVKNGLVFSKEEKISYKMVY